VKWDAYFRLMRFHKPVGILLLWIPTAWALWMANHGTPPLLLIIYFLSGTILMRAAGCVINDIADRNIDKHVTRTRLRPLTTGEISVREAVLLFILLLLAALLIVLQLPILCLYFAIAALVITIIYPFCKRFFEAPQLVLGLAFSMGIPTAYAASNVAMDQSMLLLFVLNFAWIVAYDTMYAMADREDDLRLGVKSTAVLFGQYDRVIIMLFQITLHGLWLYLAWTLHYSPLFYGFWLAAGAILVYQQMLMKQQNPTAYFAAFSVNIWYGLLMWCALIVG
jgi:4-hydroxybenzoate polyprenyltransferase